MKNDGFIMLHVLFVISLLFILIISSVSSYRNQVHITHRQIEQIQAETLFQMAREQYKSELENAEEVIDDVNYYFSQGNVEIIVLGMQENYIKLSFVVRISDKDMYYPYVHLLVDD